MTDRARTPLIERLSFRAIQLHSSSADISRQKNGCVSTLRRESFATSRRSPPEASLGRRKGPGGRGLGRRRNRGDRSNGRCGCARFLGFAWRGRRRQRARLSKDWLDGGSHRWLGHRRGRLDAAARVHGRRGSWQRRPTDGSAGAGVERPRTVRRGERPARASLPVDRLLSAPANATSVCIDLDDAKTILGTVQIEGRARG